MIEEVLQVPQMSSQMNECRGNQVHHSPLSPNRPGPRLGIVTCVGKGGRASSRLIRSNHSTVPERRLGVIDWQSMQPVHAFNYASCQSLQHVSGLQDGMRSPNRADGGRGVDLGDHERWGKERKSP